MAKPKGIVRFRDKAGRFVSPLDRYTDKVWSVQTVEHGKLFTKWRREDSGRNLEREDLYRFTRVNELEALPSIPTEMAVYKSDAAHQLWDIAKKIDRRKDIRGKFFRIDITIQDGKRTRNIKMFYNIHRKGHASYKLFEAMVAKLQLNKVTTYDRVDPNVEKFIGKGQSGKKNLVRFLHASRVMYPKSKVVKIKSVKISDIAI